MIEDKKLTDHFSLFELTKTGIEKYQDANREISDHQINKLMELAKLLEHVRYVLGVPLQISSAYRCPQVNAAVGSTNRSQHLLCEAADFIPMGLDLGESFRTLWKDVKERGANVGQLIYETAKRDGFPVSWIHISLGTPYREAARCKQILRMQDGKYELLA